MKYKKEIILFSSIIILLSALWIGFSIVEISIYLDVYGFDAHELPQALAVYFHLSKGYTIEKNAAGSVFIGNHYYIYADILEKNGYQQIDQMANLYIYENEDKSIIKILATPEWCHWFRIYTINDGRIEDLL